MHHVVAKGDPQLLEVDAHRANLLAIPAKSTAEDRIAEMPPLLFGRPLLSEKLPKKPPSAFGNLFKTFYSVDPGEFPILGSGNGGTDICTDLAVGAGLHFHKLPDTVVRIGHIPLPPPGFTPNMGGL
jgi:hypothetical protein